MQALSVGLEKDGVCKSALIGVLAIHLVQRERQLSHILRGPESGRMHALQSSDTGGTIKVRARVLLAFDHFRILHMAHMCWRYIGISKTRDFRNGR